MIVSLVIYILGVHNILLLKKIIIGINDIYINILIHCLITSRSGLGIWNFIFYSCFSSSLASCCVYFFIAHFSEFLHFEEVVDVWWEDLDQAA